MNNYMGKKESKRSGQMEGGTIVLGIGILFLLINLDILPSMRDSWPLILIIVGLTLIIGSFFKKKHSEEG